MGLFFLTVALVIAVLAALTGLKPGGARKVAGTRLMAIGRVVLALLAVVFLVAALRDFQVF